MAGSIEKGTLDSLADQMGGRDALGRIIELFTRKLPAEIEDLQVAAGRGDLETLQASAHRLKSSSGQLGAKRLSVMLAGLESASRDGDLDGASRILSQVVVEANSAQAELEELSP